MAGTSGSFNSGGGGGGRATTGTGGAGGDGGFGGGGGGGGGRTTGQSGVGGDGGFGGGGGGAGGRGGAGNVSGGAGWTGLGGNGGTSTVANIAGGGGGGGAIGGIAFLTPGSSLTLSTVAATAGSVVAGTQGTGGSSGTAGTAFGSGIVLTENSSLTLNGLMTVGYPIDFFRYLAGDDLGVTINGGFVSLVMANSYLGGTTISGGGTAILSTDDRLGNTSGSLEFDSGTLNATTGFTTSRTITMPGNATWQVDGGTMTLNGTLSGVGSLIKTGGGALTLGSTSTYTGDTTVSAGTYTISALTTLSNTGFVLVDGIMNMSATATQTIRYLSGTGTVTLPSTLLTTGDATTPITFSGNIGGAGALTKTGTGTFILTGSNTYGGLTTVSQGTLQGYTGSLPGQILNSATLIFDQAVNGTYTSTISGAGDLRVQGGGVLTFSAASSCTQNSTTILNGGILAANGTITSTGNSFTVNAGGELRGTGTILSNVSNFGTVAPGNSIGTLNITGDHTQQGGSTLEIEVSPTDASLLAVTGNFSIQPNATIFVTQNIGTYSPAQVYTIVTANTVSGFFTFETGSNISFQYDVSYRPDRVLLLLNLVPFANLVSGNALALARCLDSASPAETSDLEIIIEDLHFMSLAQMESTMNQMLPTLFNGLDLATENTLQQVKNTLSREMNVLCKSSCRKNQQFRVWGDLFKSFSSQNNHGTNVGYHSNPLGGVIGADAQALPGLFVGGSVGFAQEALSWNLGYGKGRIKNISASLYASGWIVPSLWYMQGGIIGSADLYQTARNISFAGQQFDPFTRTADGDFLGYSFLPHFETGVILREEKTQVRPFGQIDYTFVHRNGFQETGANSIDLNVDHHDASLLRLSFGAEISHCFSAREVMWDPYFSLGAIIEQRFLGQNGVASLVSLDCPMTVKGLSPDRALFFFETGVLERFFHDMCLLGLDFRGEWAGDYRNLTGSFQFKWEF